MQRDLIADLHYAIDRELSMEELDAAVDGLSGADQTRLAIGYSNAWEKRERASMHVYDAFTDTDEKVDGYLRSSRRFAAELQELWQRITVF